MNLGDIKSTGQEKVTVEKSKIDPDKLGSARNNEALKELAAEQVSLSSNAKSVATARILETSFEQNIVFTGQKEFLDELTRPPKRQPFDFEEVADNVLSFIDGAMKLAKEKGADDEKLAEMFGQAKKGVEKGFSMARKDLAGFMTPELEEGIDNSFKAIRKGLDEIEKQYLGKEDEKDAVSIGQAAAITREDSSDITLTTKEGDEVTIAFESIKSFNAQRELSIEASRQQNENQQGTESGVSAAYAESYQYFESERFSFSVKGELSQEELDDIASLVEQSSGLVDKFFNGDVNQAFQQASEIGLEDSQIAGFALELSRSETVEVVQTYERVSHYGDSEEVAAQTPPIKTISEYLDNLLKTLDKNDQVFAGRDTFDELVNGLISEVENIKTPELVEAFNRFQTFNQRLLSSVEANQS